MNKKNKFWLWALTGCFFTFTGCNISLTEEKPIPAFTSGFEELTVPEGINAYYGQNMMGDKNLGYTAHYATSYYSSGKAIYVISIAETEEYGLSWNGIAYSGQTDNTLEGLTGQFAAMPGKGGNNSQLYAIYNSTEPITFEYDKGANPQSIQITNNAYTYYSIQKGDAQAKKFGGPTGNDPDFYRLIITGLDANDQKTGEVEFYLADYRFLDNTQDYIVDSWETLDLTSLGTVSKLSFSLESSDTAEGGMNTPAYFSFDNLITQGAE